MIFPSLRKCDDSFDNATVAVEPVRKLINDSVGCCPVGNPGSKVNLTCFEIVDDTTEICASGIATAEQGQFAAMEIRIVKRNIALEQPHKDQATTVADIVKGSTHRVRVACGIEDYWRQIVAHMFLQICQRIAAPVDE